MLSFDLIPEMQQRNWVLEHQRRRCRLAPHTSAPPPAAKAAALALPDWRRSSKQQQAEATEAGYGSAGEADASDAAFVH